MRIFIASFALFTGFGAQAASLDPFVLENALDYEIIADTLNCRMGPGARYAVRHTLQQGEVVTSTGQWAPDARDLPWLQIQTQAGTCFVRADDRYLRPLGFTDPRISLVLACSTGYETVSISRNEDTGRYSYQAWRVGITSPEPDVDLRDGYMEAGNYVERYVFSDGEDQYVVTREAPERGGRIFVRVLREGIAVRTEQCWSAE